MITVVIPFFNSARFLQETIDSVKAQTYADWECLLIDDGSTDGSESIAKLTQQQDSRFRYILESDKARGVSASRNLGIQRANGDFLMFLDSDDLLVPTALEKRLATMQQDSALDVAFFQVQAFGLESFSFTPVLDDYLEAFLRFEFPFQTSSSFWKTSFVRSLEGFREDMTHLEDPEFHMQALASFPKISVLPYVGPDVKYRVWKTKFIELSDSLVSEIKSYSLYLNAALSVCDRTGYSTKDLYRGLYLMLMRVRWAFNEDIRSYILQTIEVLTAHKVIRSSTSSKLTSLLSRVDTNRPRIGVELMAAVLSPKEHFNAYKDALVQRIK